MPTGIETTIADGLMNSFGGPIGVGIVIIIFFVGLAALIKSSIEGKAMIFLCGIFLSLAVLPPGLLLWIIGIVLMGIIMLAIYRFLNK